MTAYEPGTRLATRSSEAPDGRFMAFEYLIEGRERRQHRAAVRASGFLGDDWEAEYDALSTGDRMYLRKLAVYLKHFAGRTATHLTLVPGPQVPDNDRVWSAFQDAFGLTGTAAEGDKARLSVPGLPADDGVVHRPLPRVPGRADR